MGLRTPFPAAEPRDVPTLNFHKEYRKNTPRAEIPERQENTPKIPKKYQKPAFLVFFGVFFGVFGVFWGYFLGPEFLANWVFFRYFSWKFRVGLSQVSVSGRGVLNYGNQF